MDRPVETSALTQHGLCKMKMRRGLTQSSELIPATWCDLTTPPVLSNLRFWITDDAYCRAGLFGLKK